MATQVRPHSHHGQLAHAGYGFQHVLEERPHNHNSRALAADVATDVLMTVKSKMFRLAACTPKQWSMVEASDLLPTST